MQDQNELREKTNRYILQYGIKAKHIANETNIEPSYFCRWRKGRNKFLLNDQCYAALDEFLKDKGI